MSDLRDEPGFVPITPNPFIVGNPVRDRAMFFGRQAEFELVRRRFHPPARGGLLVFSGDRRSGKTSILFQILDGRLGPDFLPALIDMQSMAVENDVGFLTRVAGEILEALGPERARLSPPDFAGGPTPSAVFLDFIAELRRSFPGKTPVLLFDEYELLGNKIESGALTVDVLHMMASVMEVHSACIVFTGSQHIEERSQEYWRILGKSLFRVISYLQRENAIQLMTRPLEGKARYEEESLDRIFRLTAGQPFYTQAVCQSLVDRMNENRTTMIDLPDVEAVAADIVENPFPQMIFLWDGLECDEKISLALLAATLDQSERYATVADLLRTLKLGRYTLKFTEAGLSTALEGLFTRDFLLKDSGPAPGYAFRMDLWRLWVRRMHSVWQVMREEGMEIRRDPGKEKLRRIAVFGAVLLAAVPLSLVLLRSRTTSLPGPPPVTPAGMEINLETAPSNAVILLDDTQVGVGFYRGSLRPDREHRLRIAAEGYAETSLQVQTAPGTAFDHRVSLRPRRGHLRVETDPPGAAVSVDGAAKGQSPITISDLDVPHAHLIAASMNGHEVASRQCMVRADTTSRVMLLLPAHHSTLLLSTDPPGAEIRIDGAVRGRSPLVLSDLDPGPLRLGASLAGYRLADTSLEVREGSQDISLTLPPEPPGVLIAEGDIPATIYFDGNLVKENVQNSGRREVPAGTHRLQIVTVSGEAFEDSLHIGSGELAIYDYTSRRVVRRSATGE
jgi:hypothetical protein